MRSVSVTGTAPPITAGPQRLDALPDRRLRVRPGRLEGSDQLEPAGKRDGLAVLVSETTLDGLNGTPELELEM